MIQLLLILLILVCLIYMLLKKEHFNGVGNLKAVGANQGIKLTWIKPSTSEDIDTYYIILSSEFVVTTGTDDTTDKDESTETTISVYVHKTTQDLIEYYIKGLPNNIIYDVTIIPKFAGGGEGEHQTKTIRTDRHSPFCLSSTNCSDNLAPPLDDDGGGGAGGAGGAGGGGDYGGAGGAGAGAGDYGDNCDAQCYNNIKQMIVENRIINVDGNYILNIK